MEDKVVEGPMSNRKFMRRSTYDLIKSPKIDNYDSILWNAIWTGEDHKEFVLPWVLRA